MRFLQTKSVIVLFFCSFFIIPHCYTGVGKKSSQETVDEIKALKLVQDLFEKKGKKGSPIVRLKVARDLFDGGSNFEPNSNDPEIRTAFWRMVVAIRSSLSEVEKFMPEDVAKNLKQKKSNDVVLSAVNKAIKTDVVKKDRDEGKKNDRTFKGSSRTRSREEPPFSPPEFSKVKEKKDEKREQRKNKNESVGKAKEANDKKSDAKKEDKVNRQRRRSASESPTPSRRRIDIDKKSQADKVPERPRRPRPRRKPNRKVKRPPKASPAPKDSSDSATEN